MKTPSTLPRITRRRLFTASAAGLAGLGLASPSPVEASLAQKGTVRDRFWIFTCAANSDFPSLRRRSLMTPVEGAFYLGVPNIMVVQSSKTEAPHGRLQPPFAQYTVAMRPLERVVWSVVGSGGFNSPEETKEVLELAKTTPNFAGIMLDDLFTGDKEGERARMPLETLADVRRQLHQINKKLPMFVTFYTRLLDLPLDDYLELVDVITLWTWNPAELVNLEANLKGVEKKAPKKKIMLGCFLYDYVGKKGVPVPMMKLQCEAGLRWLREGRIEGMIFLGNTTMDCGFDSVQWTRDWIQKVGDQPIA